MLVNLFLDFNGQSVVCLYEKEGIPLVITIRASVNGCWLLSRWLNTKRFAFDSTCEGYGIRSISPSTNDIFGNAESENEPTRLQLQCQVLVMN